MKTFLRKKGLGFYLMLTNLRMCPFSKTIEYIQKLIIFFCVTSQVFNIVSMVYAGWDKTIRTTAFYAAIGSMTNAQQVYFCFSQKSVNNLLQSFDKLHKNHKEDWEKKIFLKGFDKAWKLLDGYSVCLFVFGTCYLGLPVFVELICSLIFPSFPVIPIPMPCQEFIELAVPHSAEYFLYKIIDVFWNIFSMSSHGGFECSLICVITYARIELEIVTQKIINLKEALNKKLPRTNEMLIDIINHHQSLIKLHDQLNDLYGFPTAMQDLILAVIFCLNLYVISIVLEGAEDYLPIVQCAYALFVLTVVLYYLCSLGESLETQNNEMFYCLYDLPWPTEDIHFRKQVIMMIRQVQRPYIINYHKRSNLNLDTLMQTLQTSYSYFTMLNSA